MIKSRKNREKRNKVPQKFCYIHMYIIQFTCSFSNKKSKKKRKETKENIPQIYQAEN